MSGCTGMRLSGLTRAGAYGRPYGATEGGAYGRAQLADARMGARSGCALNAHGCALNGPDCGRNGCVAGCKLKENPAPAAGRLAKPAAAALEGRWLLPRAPAAPRMLHEWHTSARTSATPTTMSAAARRVSVSEGLAMPATVPRYRRRRHRRRRSRRRSHPITMASPGLMRLLAAPRSASTPARTRSLRTRPRSQARCPDRVSV